MAGDFEPWRGQSLTNVRVVKDQYPPRIDLSFKISDAKGKILYEGSRELKNLSFMRDTAINRQNPLRHEKRLLDDWLRRDVGGKNGSSPPALHLHGPHQRAVQQKAPSSAARA